MALVDINWHPSPKELRVFGVLQLVFFGAVAAISRRHSGSATLAMIIIAASLLAACVALAAPRAIRPLYVAWMAAVWPIGWTVSHLALACLFYLVFTPIGLIMRACGRDPLRRKFDRTAQTYWCDREVTRDSRRYFRQF
jgi:hypothetical protein